MDKISEGLPPHAHPMRRPELPDLRLRNRPPSTSRMYVSNSRACVPAGAAERATGSTPFPPSHLTSRSIISRCRRASAAALVPVCPSSRAVGLRGCTVVCTVGRQSIPSLPAGAPCTTNCPVGRATRIERAHRPSACSRHALITVRRSPRNRSWSRLRSSSWRCAACHSRTAPAARPCTL